MFPLAGRGGLDVLFFRRWGVVVEKLMYEEILGSFILSFGSPGQ